MSEQFTNDKADQNAQLPRLSSVFLLVLYFIVLPWSMLAPFFILENADMGLCVAKDREAETITAEELAIHRRAVGTHLSIVNYSTSVSVSNSADGNLSLSTSAEIIPEPPIADSITSSHVYAKLSMNTAANIVNSGELSIGRLKPLFSKTVPLPPLDAIVLSSDDHNVRVVDTDCLMTYRDVMIRRMFAGLSVFIGLASVVAIIDLHRRRSKTEINKDASSSRD